MHPILLRIPLPWGGAFEVKSYGFMIMCGFLLALYVSNRRAKRLGIEPAKMFDGAVAILLAGIVGSRLFYVIEEWGRFSEKPLEVLRIDRGGLVFYGGLIGGALMLMWFVYRNKMKLLRVGDLVTSVVPLGHAFGRMGCFLNGCCFGGRTDSLFGMCFPRVVVTTSRGTEQIIGSPPFLTHLDQGLVKATDACSLAIHPTQLYAVGYNLAIFAFLGYMFTRRRREGEIAWLYGVLYGSARFVNEIFRVEPPALLDLSIAQVICVPLILFCFVMFLRGRRLPPEPLPEPWEPPPAEAPREQKGKGKGKGKKH